MSENEIKLNECFNFWGIPPYGYKRGDKIPMYKKGDKFIIEIDETFKGEHGGFLYRLKGFNAAVWDESGLDKLRQINRVAAPMHRYRSYGELQKLDEDDMTAQEKERFNRASSIPIPARQALEAEVRKLREEVMEKEKRSDVIIDFLNGEEPRKESKFYGTRVE